MIWEKVHTRKNSARYFSESHDYIICYAKLKEEFKRNLIPRENTDAYKNPDNDPKGPWKADPIYANNPYAAEYKITKPNGIILERPKGRYWRYSEETIIKAIDEQRIIWGEGNAYPMLKRYLSEVLDGMVPVTIFDRSFAGDNMVGNNEIKNLFNTEKMFSYPKPTKLITRLLQIATSNKDDDIILDFFSGSATTAHAVMQLNAEDCGNRKFIMLQLPEVCDEKSEAYKAGYKNICEIGKERIRRVGSKLIETDEQIKIDDNKNTLDVGFKVFKLDTSNLKIWDNTPIDDEQINLLYDRMNSMINRVKNDRSDLDMVCEIMLKIGVPLTYSITQIEINNKTAYAIGDDCLLLICLAPNVQPEDIEQMVEYAPAKLIVSRESFIDDTAMANAHYILRDNGIELKLV